MPRRALNPHTRKGFALIVGLGILSFVLLLFLSLSALVSIDALAAKEQMKQNEARQQALFALQVALGELQESLGPDQRVSATAGLLDTTPQTNTIDGVQNPYWTGVWETTDANGAPMWLVSSSDPGNPLTATDTVDPDRAITLVGSGSVAWPDAADAPAGETAQGVVVERQDVNLTDKISGSIAWWVGDEGVKAKVNLPDPYEDATFSNLLDSGITSVVSQSSNLDIFLDPSNEESVNSKLSSLSYLTDLDILASDENIPARDFHNVSLDSMGLLTDVRNGGLKRNLTAAFEGSDSAFSSLFNNSGSEDAIPYNFLRTDYPHFHSGAVFEERTHNWEILRSFYQLKDDVSADQTYVGSNWRPIPDNLGLWYQNEQTFKDIGYYDRDEFQKNNPINPILSRYEYTIDIDLEPNGDGTSELIIYVRPAIGLYNPYNVNLRPLRYTTSLSINPTLDFRIEYLDEKGDPKVAKPRFSLQGLLNKNDSSVINLKTDPIGFEPGKTRYLTIPDEVDLNDGNDSQLTTLSPSYEPSGGFVLRASQFNESKGTNLAFLKNIPDFDKMTLKIWQNNTLGGSTIKASDTLASVPLDKSNTFEIQAFGEIFDDEGEQDNNKLNHRKFGGVTAIYDSPETTTGTVGSWAVYLRTTFDGDTNYLLRNLVDANFRTLSTAIDIEGFKNARGYGLVGLLTSGPDRGGVIARPGESAELEVYDIPVGEDGYESFGFTGYSILANGQLTVPLFDVPRYPLLSLGQLQNANLSRFGYEPSYLLGNSYAPFRLDRDVVMSPGTIARGYIYDTSYIINDQVWDGFFFSGMTDDLSVGDLTDYRQGKDVDELLLNQRLKILDPTGVQESLGSANYDDLIVTSSTGSEQVRDVFELSAARLGVDGAFNINSTSVDAWEAVLSMVNQPTVPVLDSSSGEIRNSLSNGVTFSRFSTPMGDGYSNAKGEDSASDDFWRGYRTLDEEQIRWLAQEIVKQVKLRGPFLSMSDFINRKLVASNAADAELGLSGTLQAALDSTETELQASNRWSSKTVTPINSIDSGLSEEITVTENGQTRLASSFEDPFHNEHVYSPRATGYPGYLLQGDLLQQMAPMLTARSDTFKIRAYGDVRNPLTDKIESKAYCEVIVQRTAEPVEIPATGTSDISEEIQKPTGAFGRQFQIVKFRWLNEDEV